MSTRVTIVRPNTIGVTFSAEYHSHTEAEEFIERRVEALCNRGWNAIELKGSTSKNGCVELTHDKIADVILIQWKS